jgi:DNA-binding MarR family transcriptional regulator
MPPTFDELEREKTASLGQVLFRAARLYNELAVGRLQAQNPEIRLAHTRLLPHLSHLGSRPSAIARAAGVSKQAAGALLADLERAGVVERVPDPADGRARLVRISAAGREAMVLGLRVLAELAAELSAELGPERLAHLHDELLALLAALEEKSAATLPR